MNVIAQIINLQEKALLRKLTKIATKNFSNVETLETRNSDSLDFHDIAVWDLKKALEEAYEAGRQAGLKGE